MNPIAWRKQGERSSTRASGLPDLGPAPEFAGIHAWLNVHNAPPPTTANLSGQFTLIEFWTFACANCLNTLPFLRRIHQRHHPELCVIAIHTPESSFERHTGNVAAAVQEQGLTFPVALDNDFATWNAYGTKYWPSSFLIDRRGRIRCTQVGEGRYRRTEAAIRALLAESAPVLDPAPRHAATAPLQPR